MRFVRVIDDGTMMVWFWILDHDYMQFYGDEFLRMIILRYCFCVTTLTLHRAFKVIEPKL